MAPIPVRPSSSQADSPVAWAENAATQKPRDLPPITKSFISVTRRAAR